MTIITFPKGMDYGKIEEGLKRALLEEGYNILSGVLPDFEHIGAGCSGS